VLVEHNDLVSCVVITNDNRSVISGSHDTRLIIWNLDKGDVEHQLLGHTGHVTAVSVTYDGSTVVSGTYVFLFSNEISLVWRSDYASRSRTTDCIYFTVKRAIT